MANFILEKTQNPEGSATGQVRLQGDVTIATADELRMTLKEAVQQCQELILDGSRVTDLDLAGLQVLCSLHRTAVAAGKSVQIYGLDEGCWPDALKAAGLYRHEACADFSDKSDCLWMY